MSAAEASLLGQRLHSQLLAGPPARDPEAVAEQLLAIQAQDPRGARLAIRARTAGLTAAHVDRALSEERSLLITWLNRGTLHLVRSEDYPWLHAATAPALFASNARRLAQEGVMTDAADRAVTVVVRSLAEEGPLTRAQLGERIRAAGLRTDGQALVHVLMLASLRGLAVRGPMIGRQHAYVLVREWLGEPRPVDRHRGLVELARRYLVGRGPASDRDLAKWSGLALRDVRVGLAGITSRLQRQEDGLFDLAGRVSASGLPPPRLLGSFDPVLHGWSSRELAVPSHQRLIVSGGVFRPFALVGGRAAGTWTLSDDRIVLRPFRNLSRRDADALERDGRDVVRFLGRP